MVTEPALADGEEELRFPPSSCFGCSRENPAGLKLPFFRSGQDVLTRYSVPERYCGAPGVVHGGILATIVDEVSCAAVAFNRGHYVVTGELTIRYLKACPTEKTIEVRGRITEERPKYFVVETEVRIEADLVARSTGRFFPVQRAVE